MQSRHTLEINAGATFRHRIRPMIETDGVRWPYNLTGAMAKLYIRDSQHMRVAEYTLEIGEGANIEIHLSPEQTSKFQPHRRYFYIIDIVYPNGDIERILDGPLRVRPFTAGVR